MLFATHALQQESTHWLHHAQVPALWQRQWRMMPVNPQGISHSAESRASLLGPAQPF
jgi:hypothetical protein